MVDLSEFSYVPILAVRPSEITALEELLPADKDSMLPYIVLRPWLAAHHFEPVIAKVEAAIGHRPIIADLTPEPFETGDGRRPVHDVFDGFRDSASGYENFYDFLEENENFIPSLQLANPNEIARQVPRIIGLDRGVAVRLRQPMFGLSVQIAQQLRQIRDQSTIHFIIDFERQSSELLARAAGAIGVAEGIRNVLPDAFISVSASTFPSSFVGVDQQEIFERRFYDLVTGQIGTQNVIYSDRGSVRAEALGGGGGAPAPRIDNALPTNWHFYRVDGNDMDRDEAFQQAAEDAISSEHWTNLGIWGTGEIIKTANGHGTILSAQRSTAVRINIHLHRQANFGDPQALPDSESEWTD